MNLELPEALTNIKNYTSEMATSIYFSITLLFTVKPDHLTACKKKLGRKPFPPDFF
jgi:hypothetical protein